MFNSLFKKVSWVVLLLIAFVIGWQIAVQAAAGNKVVASEVQGTLPQAVVNASVSQGPTSLYSVAKATLRTVTPTVAGQLVYCSDCFNAWGATCISSGTQQGAFVLASSSAPAAAACK